jgi:hypothetical protein
VKNQYFGDVNDYRKYGLLRSIIRAGDLRLCVAWMLTPDDGSTDGKFLSYLEAPRKWMNFDAELFQGIRKRIDSGSARGVRMIERSGLLPGSVYYSGLVPDSAADRDRWFHCLQEAVTPVDMVFLDPDNGIEVKSKPYGRKHSCKYVFRKEIRSLWANGQSLLVYQHFVRQKRFDFVQRMLDELADMTPGSSVDAFSTANVVFLLALQRRHHALHEPINTRVQENWSGQIHHWELTRRCQAAS